MKVIIVRVSGPKQGEETVEVNELAFWEEVQFWRMFRLPEVQTYAKSRRLSVYGSKTKLAEQIAAVELTKAVA